MSQHGLKLAEEIGYLYMAPVIMAAGLLGSLASLAFLRNSRFRGNRFYTYLKAVALADLAFLSFAVASIVLNMDLRWEDSQEVQQESPHYLEIFYLARIDRIATNTFLTAAAFLIVCVTIDRYFAICRPTFYVRRRSQNDSAAMDIALSFVCGFVLQVPRFFTHKVIPTSCQVNDNLDSNNSTCACKSGTDANYTCYYGSEVTAITTSSPWLTYAVLNELLARVFPCVLLVVLNLLMVRDFHVSLRRRSKLKATVFTISTSAIFNQATVVSDMTPGRKFETVDEEGDISRSVRKEPDFTRLLRPRHSHFAPLGVPKLLTKLRGSRDARRKSLTLSAKEKGIIRTLCLIATSFLVCNLPQALCRLCEVFGNFEDSLSYQIFRVVSNLLELLDASANFCMYCMFNREVRNHVISVLKDWNKRISADARKQTTSTRGNSISMQMLENAFPQIFQEGSTLQ